MFAFSLFPERHNHHQIDGKQKDWRQEATKQADRGEYGSRQDTFFALTGQRFEIKLSDPSGLISLDLSYTGHHLNRRSLSEHSDQQKGSDHWSEIESDSYLAITYNDQAFEGQGEFDENHEKVEETDGYQKHDELDDSEEVIVTAVEKFALVQKENQGDGEKDEGSDGVHKHISVDGIFEFDAIPKDDYIQRIGDHAD